MNDYQALWWQQVQSDYDILLLLRKQDALPCQQLHYLQMVTEKLGKAYFWRSNTSPPKSHAGFVKFLRALGGVRSSEHARLAGLFGFKQFKDFRYSLNRMSPLAYDLERLAPALARDNGPNPEYPWPTTAPKYTPVTYEFDIWKQIMDTGRGRELLKFIDTAVRRFDDFS